MSKSALNRVFLHRRSIQRCKVFLSVCIILLPLCSGLLFQYNPEVAAQESFFVENYKVDVISGLDASFAIEETIEVRFTSELHGIIRSIPIGQDSLPYYISDLNVEGDPFTIEYDSSYVRLRIGDANQYVSGTKIYRIRYTLTFPKDETAEYDYAYINLIGTDWDTQINHAELTFHYPADNAVPVVPDGYEIYTGVYGGESTDSAAATADGEKIVVSLTRPLSNFEGVTILARFPENTLRLAQKVMYPYEMSDYKSDIVVAKDKSVHITETFRIRINDFSSPVIHHIPGIGTDNIYYNVRDITLNGSRIGTASGLSTYDVYIPGDGDYTIGYTIRYPYRTADEKSSLHLELFSIYREVPLESAVITVASPFTPLEASAEYSGLKGSEEPVALSSGSGNILIATAPSALAPYEGVYLDIRYPNSSFGFIWSFGYLLLVVIPLLLILIAAVLYKKFGKDDTVSPVIEFYPPDGLSSGSVGYVINRVVNPIDMTSMLLYWASHNHLKFVATGKKDFYISLEKDIDDAHPAWEQRAFGELKKLLDSSGNVMSKSTLEEKFYQVAEKMKSAIPLYFKNEHNLDDSKAKGMSALTAFFSFSWALIFTAVIVFSVVHDFVPSFISGIITGICSLIAYGMFYYISAGWYQRTKAGNFAAAALALAAVAAGILIYMVFMFFSETLVPFPFILLNIISIFIVQIIAVFIQKRSVYGQRLLERVVGFKEFLIQAEKERLEALLNEDPEYYYHILPFTLVLGVSDIWENKFSNISMTEPSWYEGGYPGYIYSAAALSSFARSASTDMSRHTAPPSSSGGGGGGGGGFSGGGGGFSGGGGGGGGGSGW
ncbi:MAG: DUF2207 family protein [Saccharofermentanales bacterium]